MKISIRKHQGDIQYKSILSVPSIEMEKQGFFVVSKEDAKNYVIVSEEKHIKDVSLNDVKSGVSQIKIAIYASEEFVNNTNASVFVRSLVMRLKSFKGALINEEIKLVPSSSISSIYDACQKEYEKSIQIKKKKNELNDITSSSSFDVKEISTDATNDFSTLCRASYNLEASDIHIMLNEEEDKCDVEVRVFGEIEPFQAHSSSYKKGLQMVSAAYAAMADSSSRSHGTFSPKLRQDCRIPLDLGDGEKIALRYSSSPTGWGTNIVLRILTLKTKKKHIATLYEMGLLDSQIKMLLSILRKPVGALIVAGITGSGKSTTLRVLIEELIRLYPNKKFITIEQPIEYEIPGVVQINVFAENEKDTKPGISCARTALRQDPDGIMVGEVRDEDGANILASAVESGHQVMATVHASSALEVPSRLSGQAMRLPLDTVASLNFISGLIYQKLVPVLCEHCKIPFGAEGHECENEDFINRVGSVTDLEENQVYVRNHKGCPHCNHRGITGREACIEIVIPDIKMRQFWLKGDFLGAYEHWRSTKDKNDDTNTHGKTALEIAIIKMNQGRVCPHDIEAVFGNINEDFVMEDGVRSFTEVLS
jgi:type II secretory ATPase GspE/PulE/Tfp pilus assembly ATPase PilB-like protein